MLTDTLAVTGARPSQAVRLRVEDLHDHPVRPKLMMPKSAKGGDRNRAEKKLERYSVPITVQLAARLKAAAKGRAEHAPLLLQGDGTPWGDNPGASYHREVKQIVADIGADPDATMYALRHSSIVRMLKANVPIRLVAIAAQHQHQDDREALLDTSPSTATISRATRYCSPSRQSERMSSRSQGRCEPFSGRFMQTFLKAGLNRILLWPFKYLPT